MRIADRRSRRGATLVELTISMVISGLLLAALGAAFHASAAGMQGNERITRATQTARISLNQMLTEIRRANAVQVFSDRVDLITDQGLDRSYIFDAAAGQLRLVLNDVDGKPEYVLARNVGSAAFTADTRLDETQPGVWVSVVTRVTIDLQIGIDSTQLRVSGSVVPRRSLIY